MKLGVLILTLLVTSFFSCSGRKPKAVEVAEKEDVPPKGDDAQIESPIDSSEDQDYLDRSLPDGNLPYDNGTPYDSQPYNPDFGSPNNPFNPDLNNPYNPQDQGINPFNPNPNPDFNPNPDLNQNPNPDFNPGPNPDFNPGPNPGPNPNPDFNPGPNPGPNPNQGDLNIKFDFNDPNLTTWDGTSDVTNGNFKIVDVP